MIRFKDILVAKSSALYEAIQRSPQEANKVYAETTERYKAMYPEADRAWFAQQSRSSS